MGAYDVLGQFTADGGDTISAAGFSDNFIDMAVTKPQLGVGQHVPHLCIRTNTAPTDPADSLSIELQASATNNGTDLNGTIKTVMMALAGVANAGSGVNEVIATDARLATAGAWIYRGPLPYGLDLRYVQLYFNNTISGGDFVIDAWLEDVPASDFRGSQKLFSDVGQP